MSVSSVNQLNGNYDYNPLKTENLKGAEQDVSIFGDKIIGKRREYDFETEQIELDFDYSDNESTKSTASEKTLANLKSEFEDTKSKQGLIGKAWDGIKNIFGMKNGSDKVEETIKKAEKGEISLEEAQKHLEKYKAGQKQSVDLVADIASGIASFATFSFATGVGLAAAPFTGGASLGLVAAGLGIAGTSGALVKTAVKGADAAIGGREYDSLGYDLATGGINGIFAPITAGIGGAVGKSVAGRLGVSAVREGGEVLVKEGLKQTAKGAITKTILTTNITYTGGTMLTRGLALGADMAVNGAITGGVDSAVRYIAGDNENKSLEGFIEEVGTGTIGGAIASPIIGGGMRLAGNGIGKITGKLSNEVADSYATAQRNLLNMPTVENPDADFVRSLSGVLKDAEGFLDGIQIDTDGIYKSIEQNIDDVTNSGLKLFDNVFQFSDDFANHYSTNTTQMRNILEDILSSDNIPEAIQKYAEKGINIADFVDDKVLKSISTISDDITKYSDTLLGLNKKTNDANDLLYTKMQEGFEIAQNGLEKAKDFTQTSAYKQLGNLPDRTKTAITEIAQNNTDIQKLALNIQQEITNGNNENAAKLLKDYFTKIDEFNIKMTDISNSASATYKKAGLADAVDILDERIKNRLSSADFSSLSKNEQIQAIIEDSNIALPKFIQTLSSDENLPPEMKKFFKQFTSNCTVSRNLDEAQALADELYGAGKYTIKKSFGAGTIGETYLSEAQDGTQYVIKMLKEGVNLEKFEADRNMFTKYVEEFITDETEKEYKLKLINGLFDSWGKELDFSLEAKGAANMAKNAQRYNVAQTVEVGTKNGQNISLVIEKADGVRLDSMLDMIKYAKQNPDDYLTKSVLDANGKETNPWIKNASVIEENPWLKDYSNWEKDLTQVFQKAQNEQVMFVPKNGTRTIHADPHTGNIFIDFDAKTGKPVINYIDTGNTITRTQNEMLSDMALSINMLIGNSEGIADYLLKGATLPNGANKQELAKQVASMLDEKLYNANINLKSTAYTQNVFDSVMKELNIIPNADDSNLMKATLQRIKTSREIASVTGYGSPKSIDIKDLMSGLSKSFKANPAETIKTMVPILKWAKNNNKQAMNSFFQIIAKPAATPQ